MRFIGLSTLVLCAAIVPSCGPDEGVEGTPAPEENFLVDIPRPPIRELSEQERDVRGRYVGTHEVGGIRGERVSFHSELTLRHNGRYSYAVTMVTEGNDEGTLGAYQSGGWRLEAFSPDLSLIVFEVMEIDGSPVDPPEVHQLEWDGEVLIDPKHSAIKMSRVGR